MNSCEDGSGFQQPEAILQTMLSPPYLLKFKQPFNQKSSQKREMRLKREKLN